MAGAVEGTTRAPRRCRGGRGRILAWATLGLLVVVVVGALILVIIFVAVAAENTGTRPPSTRPEPVLAASPDVQDHAAAQAAFVHFIKDVCSFFEGTAGDAGADVMSGGEVQGVANVLARA